MSWDTRSLLELLEPPELPADGVLMSCDTRPLPELPELLEPLELPELLDLLELLELPETLDLLELLELLAPIPLNVGSPLSARLCSKLRTQLGISWLFVAMTLRLSFLGPLPDHSLIFLSSAAATVAVSSRVM